MSNIKKYIIDYDWKASIEIEIDHDVMTEEKLHQINNFWSDSEYRLNKHGSLLNAVLIMLAQHALLIAISSDLNAYGVVCEFDWNDGNDDDVEFQERMAEHIRYMVETIAHHQVDIDSEV
ncbi:DUF2528 family protein [Escherichia coli]|uniref:DUF2528 family protein n=1 Tax=Escherichia coli TaxID=562 RepID=UPI000BE1BF04|nr:DUF2528 family protein [Escherichia coli]EFA6699481.1 DUF2528 family protein [Escherichia coli]